jgi:hypothetical protein
VGFDKKLKEAQDLDNTYSKNKCAILNNATDLCASSFGIKKAGSTWYNPLQLPSSEPGTEPLSNLPGTPLTDFGAASITLKLFPGYSSVITPASFNAQNAGPISGPVLDTPIPTGNATDIATDTAAATAAATTTAATTTTATGTEASGSTGSATGTGATASKTGGASISDMPSGLLGYGTIIVILCNLGFF